MKYSEHKGVMKCMYSNKTVYGENVTLKYVTTKVPPLCDTIVALREHSSNLV